MNSATLRKKYGKIRETVTAAVLLHSLTKMRMYADTAKLLESFNANLIAIHYQLIEQTIWVILDFSGVSSVDPAAAKSIMALMKVYLRKGINLIFVGCSPPLLPVMERVGLMKTAGLDHFYPNVPSALHFMKRGLLRRRRSVSKCLPMPPQSTLVDIGTQVEEELVEDLDEFHVVGDTADYFRRLSISMSNRR